MRKSAKVFVAQALVQRPSNTEQLALLGMGTEPTYDINMRGNGVRFS